MVEMTQKTFSIDGETKVRIELPDDTARSFVSRSPNRETRLANLGRLLAELLREEFPDDYVSQPG